MKGILKESYTKSDGRTVFVYFLQGSESELVNYKLSVGSHYREENGQPLFYTLFYYGPKVNVNKSLNKGTYFVKNEEFDKMKSIIEQFGGNLHHAFYEQTKDKNWLLTEKNESLLRTKDSKYHHNSINSSERTFENYNGTYAQDIEGYSDQDIDDIFEGDPDMYWNID